MEKDVVMAVLRLIRHRGYFGSIEVVTSGQRLILVKIAIGEGNLSFDTRSREMRLLTYDCPGESSDARILERGGGDTVLAEAEGWEHGYERGERYGSCGIEIEEVEGR